MKVPKKYYDEVFHFAGQWDQPSACGLKILNKNNKIIIIVTELYQDNPGTSITSAGINLAKQICKKKDLDLSEIVYLECTPNTDSVLSFYEENYFEVKFNDTLKACYRKLSKNEILNIFS